MGHVAIVEEITDDEKGKGINTSNSGYPSNFFWTERAYESGGWKEPSWMGSDWHFQGFILNPYA